MKKLLITIPMFMLLLTACSSTPNTGAEYYELTMASIADTNPELITEMDTFFTAMGTTTDEFYLPLFEEKFNIDVNYNIYLQDVDQKDIYEALYKIYLSTIVDEYYLNNLNILTEKLKTFNQAFAEASPENQERFVSLFNEIFEYMNTLLLEMEVNSVEEAIQGQEEFYNLINSKIDELANEFVAQITELENQYTAEYESGQLTEDELTTKMNELDATVEEFSNLCNSLFYMNFLVIYPLY